MTKRKPKAPNYSLYDELQKEARHCDECAALLKTIDPFAEYWGRAEHPMQVLLRKDDAAFILNATRSVRVLLDCLRGMIRENPDAGEFAFQAAQSLCRDVMDLAQHNPPDWLKKLAATEYEVPWLMLPTGKPAPGFAKADATLAWGKIILKRGKSRDNRQTRDVASAMRHIESVRNFDKRFPQRGATLPPLSRKTRGQWWRVVRAHIRRTVKLTPEEKEKLAGSADYETESAILNEYMKRCRAAFNALCPAE